MKRLHTTTIFLFVLMLQNVALGQINLQKAKDKIQQKSKSVLNNNDKNKTSKEPDKNSDKEISQPINHGSEVEQEDEEKKPEKFTGYQKSLPPPAKKDQYGRMIGEILFSKKPITYGKEDKATITNVFTAGDEVFGMAYLHDTKKNMRFERGYQIWVHDAEDGRGYSANFQVPSFEYKTNSEGKNPGDQKYYDLDIFATPKNAWDKELTKELLQFMSLYLKQAPKSAYGDRSKQLHRFEVQLIAEGFLVAKGDFYYDLTNNSEKMHQMYEEYKQADLKEFKLPVSKRNDPALAEKLKQVMTKEGVNVQKVVFSTADWGMIRHQISGNVLRRSIWAYIVYKNEKGECHYDDVQFTEEFVGGKFVGIIKKQGYGTAHGQILCENINK